MANNCDNFIMLFFLKQMDKRQWVYCKVSPFSLLYVLSLSLLSIKVSVVFSLFNLVFTMFLGKVLKKVVYIKCTFIHW